MKPKITEFLNLSCVKDVTSEQKFAQACLQHKGVYCGFDPTSASLHLGNYIQINMLKRLQQLGLKPIIVIGSATGFIGDPSGKNKERVLLDKKTIRQNAQKLTVQIKNLLGNDCIFVDNYDWLHSLNFLEFLRDYGKLFNLNNLLKREQIQARIAGSGISYTEFSYILLQSYDFAHLFNKHDCHVQIGGSDQWYNIVVGIDLIRKVNNYPPEDNPACGLTFNLLVNKDGTKFGKSENNALYLDKNLTKPYEIYQYLMNVSDDLVQDLFYYLTTKKEAEIKEILASNPVKNLSVILAKIVINDLFGSAAVDHCTNVSQLLFTKNIFMVSNEQFNHVISQIKTYQISSVQEIIPYLLEHKFISSKSELHRLYKMSSIQINHQTITGNELPTIKPYLNKYF